MKFYAKIISPNETHSGWLSSPPKESGWYELEREPDPSLEYLEYDSKQDAIVIKIRSLELHIETPLEKLEKRVTLLEQAIVREKS